MCIVSPGGPMHCCPIIPAVVVPALPGRKPYSHLIPRVCTLMSILKYTDMHTLCICPHGHIGWTGENQSHTPSTWSDVPCWPSVIMGGNNGKGWCIQTGDINGEPWCLSGHKMTSMKMLRFDVKLVVGAAVVVVIVVAAVVVVSLKNGHFAKNLCP